MNPKPGSKMRMFKIVLASLLVLGVITFGYWTRTRTQKGRNCRICAVSYDHWNVFAFGIPVGAWDTKPEPTADTRNYFDQYLAYPHEHEWTGGGYSRYGLNFVGCGKSHFGPYPQHQLGLTQMGFQLVAASGIKNSDERRRYFESIVHPSDGEHLFRVRKTHEAIHDQIPKEPWVKWAPYQVWGPDMEGIKIPDYVRAGKLSPEPL